MFNDPQYQARELLESVTVDGEPLVIPAIVPRLPETPGSTRLTGPKRFSKRALMVCLLKRRSPSNSLR